MSVDTDSVELVGDEVAGNIARAAVFAALTAATAPVGLQHPLVPGVPITLQTFWMYLAGFVLGPLWGAASFGLYVVAGLAGLPVFEDGGGIGYLLGPTGGYIVGFVLSAAVIGLVVHGVGSLRDPREVSVPRLVAALAAGTAVTYLCGAAWLVVGQGAPLVETVLAQGAFLPTAIVKAAAAIAVVRSGSIIAR
jgi:biotin transport system substrate-specific component